MSHRGGLNRHFDQQLTNVELGREVARPGPHEPNTDLSFLGFSFFDVIGLNRLRQLSFGNHLSPHHSSEGR